MYISVLTADLNTDPWLAVQWSNSLQTLLNNNRYEAGVNREFSRSGSEPFIQTKSIKEISTPAGWVTAHVYQVVGVRSFLEVAGIAPKKKKKVTPKKKVEKKPALKKEIARKKSTPKKAVKKSNKKSGNKNRK